VQSTFPQILPFYRRIPRIVFVILGILYAIIHTFTGWYWIPKFVDGSLPGWYWPLLFYTIAVEPIMVVGLIVGVFLLVLVMIRRRRGDENPGRRRWGIILIFVSIFIGLTGLPAVFQPLFHAASTTINFNTYHLARHVNLGNTEVLLFECDFAGASCTQVFRSDPYDASTLRDISLVPDVPRGTVTVKVCTVQPGQTNISCTSIKTFQQRLFE
jgi:hypothetical protein